MFAKDLEKLLIQFSEYLHSEEKAPATIYKYLHDVQFFKKYIESQKIFVITKQVVIDYKNSISVCYKPASLNSMIIALNHFFVWARTPHLKVKTVRIQRKSSFDTMFSRAEYIRLLETAKANGMERIYLIMRLLASTGIRVGEIRFITVENLHKAYIPVQHKGKAREVYIPESIYTELSAYCQKYSICAGVIFHGKDPGRMLDKARIWRELHKVSVLAGFPPGKIHAQNFRHFFAKEYIAKYNDVSDLADILGHSSIETTRLYIRTSGLEKRQRINSLGL